MIRPIKHFPLLALALLLIGCGGDLAPTTPTPPPAAAIQVTSPAFAEGTAIPATYTCSGANTSPAIAWGDPPSGTQSLALLMEDPDAPGNPYVHWVVFNLPASSRGLPENVAPGVSGPDGSIQGRNSSDHNGYTGPCPPSGTHHYHFRLYALDSKLDLQASADRNTVFAAFGTHVLAQGELIGTFAK